MKNTFNQNLFKGLTFFALLFGAVEVHSQTLAKGEKQVILERIATEKSYSQMVMGVTEMPAGESKPFHIHTMPEVVYVLEGEVAVTMKDKEPFTVTQGKSFQIPPDLLHSTKAGPKGAKVVFTIVK